MIEHGSRRRIGIRLTANGTEHRGEIRIERRVGIALADPNASCDFEIELSGICGNHAIRLNLSEPPENPA